MGLRVFDMPIIEISAADVRRWEMLAADERQEWLDQVLCVEGCDGECGDHETVAIGLAVIHRWSVAVCQSRTATRRMIRDQRQFERGNYVATA